jgi:hypothetical protein
MESDDDPVASSCAGWCAGLGGDVTVGSTADGCIVAPQDGQNLLSIGTSFEQAGH